MPVQLPCELAVVSAITGEVTGIVVQPSEATLAAAHLRLSPADFGVIEDDVVDVPPIAAVVKLLCRIGAGKPLSSRQVPRRRCLLTGDRIFAFSIVVPD